MINFKLSSEKFPAKGLGKEADCYVVFLEKDFEFKKAQDGILLEIEKNYFPNLQDFFELKNFKGEEKSVLLTHAFDGKKVVHFAFIGLGKRDNIENVLDIENFRRALGLLIRVAEKNKFKNISMNLPESSLFGVDEKFLARQVAIILNIASYHFDCFITQEACKLPSNYNITLIIENKKDQSNKKDKKDNNIKKDILKEIEAGLQEGEIVGLATNKARGWIDMPAAQMHPQQLAQHAKDIAKDNKLKIKIFGEKEIIEMGMGGLEAVSKGSDRDCALVIMEYKTTKKGAPTLAFVGKGITFDSGGLSLKPANYMETMKEDMSGAAAVIASMEAFAKLKPDVNIIAVAPISENLPSGKATKPGDIIRFYNGKTAEVRNTDAEGRLILADALSYVEKTYKPDAIIDLATLTGACQYALGHFYCGMMSKSKDLTSRVQSASELSGDRVWNLPFHDDYKAAIKSTVADISNTGNPKYMAGTITAGFFLQNFVEHTPWLHLDIAGTAFDMPDVPYYRDGATGFGVRLLVELVKNWA